MAAAMIAPGDFSFLKDQMSEVILKDMYDAVTESENWDNLKRFVPGDGGFMYCNKPEWFSRIDQAVKYDGHSGASHGWTMRCIDYIAKHGWDNFTLKMSKPDEATKRRLRILELPYSIQEARNALEAWEQREHQATDQDAKDRLRDRISEAACEVENLEAELRQLSR